jgi:hypothetical protein
MVLLIVSFNGSPLLFPSMGICSSGMLSVRGPSKPAAWKRRFASEDTPNGKEYQGKANQVKMAVWVDKL